MAARIHRLHSEDIRQKIQASVIVNRLHKHVMGEIEMTPSQVKAAAELLDRSVPKLAQIQHVGADGGPVQIAWPIPPHPLER